MATRTSQQTPVPFASSAIQAAAPIVLDSCSPAPADACRTATGAVPSSAAAAPAGDARRRSGEDSSPVFESGARALNLADFEASSFASSSVSSRRGPRQGARLAFSGAAGAIPAAAMASPASDDEAEGAGARRSLTMLLEGESDDEDAATAPAAAPATAVQGSAGASAGQDDDEVVVAEEEEEAEEEDDEAFARRLMREESMLAYQQLQQASVEMALASMRGQAGGDVDEDTRLSLQLMMAEVQAMNGGDEEQMARLAEAAEVVADADAEEGAAADGMGYDELLQLGEQLGDVRKERWQARAPALIAALPRGEWSGSGEPMCAICRCEWEEGSADVLKLPCGHEFHEDCGGHWLKDNDTCPCCKASIEVAGKACKDKEDAAVVVGEGSPQQLALESAAASVAGRSSHTAVAAMAAAAAAIGSPGGDAVAAALHHAAAAAAAAGAPSSSVAASSAPVAAGPSDTTAGAAAALGAPATPLPGATPCGAPVRRSRKRPEPEQ